MSLRRILHRGRDRRAPGRTWRAIEVAPWQVPILAWFLIEGIFLFARTPDVAVKYDLPVWSIYNFAGALTFGALAGLMGRFREHIRLETIGMMLTLMALIEAAILASSIHQYDGILEIGVYSLACVFRWITLSKARKAEKMAREISKNNNHHDQGEA